MIWDGLLCLLIGRLYFSFLFSFSFKKYLSGIHYVPDARDTSENESYKSPYVCGTLILEMEETKNKQIHNLC